MKKLLAMLLCAVMLLTACQTATENQSESQILDESRPENDNKKADMQISYATAVSIKSLAITEANGKVTLDVLWKNDTDYEVIYGEMFWVERNVDGKWVSCDDGEENAFIEIARVLVPRSEHTKKYNVSNYYDVTKLGDYRLMTECYIHISENETKKGIATADFSLTEDGYIVPEYAQIENQDPKYQQLRLSVDLFKAMSKESKNKDLLISPLSIELALAMTANGAKGQTKSEIEKLLCGDMTVEELNLYLNNYVSLLPTDDKYKMHIANSIWFRDEADRLTVNEAFLKKNKDYYGAQIFKKNFGDSQTVTDINDWVKTNTDGMIDKIVDGISGDTVMYLINALCFDAEWEKQYLLSDIIKRDFTNISAETKKVDMMHSEESYYIETENAKGFMKHYKDKKYSFVALIPNENDIYGYIDSLTPEYIESALNNVQNKGGYAVMPKFSYEYELSMNGVLKSLGMPTAFDGEKADFTDMAISTHGNIFIGDVLHKTFIQVDELGTKAGAVTKVEMWDECAPMYEWEITLDRPFVYMIIDNANNMPIFMGTLTDVK
ncbi:MAG: serpin family protein [Clostridia bacterium]|nr:serpin family protein [Clostridia bacterium]